MLNRVDTVAVRVRALRERRGWSQNALAARAEIGVSTVSRIEAGVIASPGIDVLRKISGALGVDLTEITGERPMPRRRAEVTEGVVRVPLRTLRVQAGSDPVWDDTRDTIIVSARVGSGRPNIFAAVVSGQCMEPYALPGDIVVVDPDQQPVDRDMVVVTDPDGGTLVKWYRLDEEGRPYLRAADGTQIRPNGAKVEGVVLAIERKALRDPDP